ncbi:MAG: AAA family ATPase [Promethearchaeota archaeon]
MAHSSPYLLYITGVTGTGKTSVAKKLSKQLTLDYVELNTVILEKGFYLGYDIDRDSVIIDDDLLISYLESELTTKRRLCLIGMVVPLEVIFDLVIVLRCRIDILKQRLLARNYPEMKIEANIEAEIMNISYYDAIDLLSYNQIVEVSNDDMSIDETCLQIVSLVRQHHPSVLE